MLLSLPRPYPALQVSGVSWGPSWLWWFSRTPLVFDDLHSLECLVGSLSAGIWHFLMIRPGLWFLGGRPRHCHRVRSTHCVRVVPVGVSPVTWRGGVCCGASTLRLPPFYPRLQGWSSRAQPTLKQAWGGGYAPSPWGWGIHVYYLKSFCIGELSLLCIYLLIYSFILVWIYAYLFSALNYNPIPLDEFCFSNCSSFGHWKLSWLLCLMYASGRPQGV